MVTSPTGKGVIVMGGMTKTDSEQIFGKCSKSMFELAPSMQWTRLEQNLQIGHGFALAIPITDELVRQKIESKTNEEC